MIQETIGAMQQAVQERLLHCRTAQDVQAVRVQYLGKKGELTALLKGMKNVPPAERPAFGQLVNAARSALEAKLQERQAEVEEQEMATRLQSETLDITLPSRQPVRGHASVAFDTAAYGRSFFADGIFPGGRPGN